MRALERRVALVTGGGVRLGRAIAEGLGSSGAAVAVHYHRSRSGADQAVERIMATGGTAQAFGADLTDDGQIARLVSGVEQALGPISVLVNSAALFERAPFLETSVDVLDRQWRLNVRAPFLLTQAVARRMVEAGGGGDIVNVVDIGGAVVPWRGYSAYGLTKAALAHLTRVWALELAPTVRVNAVAPGMVLAAGETPPKVLERLRKRTPLANDGSPDDVVQAVLFLLRSSFVTGQVMTVDGGRSLETAGD